MTDDPVTIGVDYGTLSGRAVVVRVSDGEELGSAVLDYPHAVLDRSLPADLAGADVRLGPDWALQVPADYVAVLRTAVPAALADAGVDPGRVIGIATDFTACTMVPTTADGTPLCELPAHAADPHAYVKLWKHHAAQPQADRINELARKRGEAWLPQVRRADLVRVGVRQGPRAARGGAGALRRDGVLRRGRRLDRLAAVRQLRPQRLHRRLQGHLPGRHLPDPRLPGRARPGASRPSSRTSSTPRSASWGQSPAPSRPRPRPGPGFPKASPSPSATSTRTSPHRPRTRSASARWSRSWAPRPAT